MFSSTGSFKKELKKARLGLSLSNDHHDESSYGNNSTTDDNR